MLGSVRQCKAKGKIAQEFGIANSTLTTIINNQKRILAAFNQDSFEPGRKHMRIAAYDDLEKALLIWFKSI